MLSELERSFTSTTARARRASSYRSQAWVTWAINPTVRAAPTVLAAQADAIARGCPTCRRGVDADSLDGPNRLEDATSVSPPLRSSEGWWAH
jgi:hypothetical protein